MLLLLILISVCILATGFFNGAETALMSVDKPLLRAQAQKGSRPAQRAELLLATPARLLATILVGVNLMHVCATTLATLVIGATNVPEAWHSAVTTAVMVPVILLFADLLPKSIARGNPQLWVVATSRGLQWSQQFLTPVVAVMSAMTNGVLRLAGIKEHAHTISVTREEVQALADISVEQGVIGVPEYKMIRRVFELNTTTLVSAMVPLVELECVPISATLNDVLAIARATRHRRFPVFEERADNIVGLVHIADVLDVAARNAGAATWMSIKDVIDRDVPFMPETKTVGSMLHDLQIQPVRYVFVVNEYGGVTGMITIRTIAEQIVGDWAHERPEDRPVMVDRRGIVECEGRVDVDAIAEKFSVTFDKDGYDTVAGLLLKHLGRVPKPGDTLTYQCLLITVLRATPKRVVSVSIERKAY